MESGGAWYCEEEEKEEEEEEEAKEEEEEEHSTWPGTYEYISILAASVSVYSSWLYSSLVIQQRRCER